MNARVIALLSVVVVAVSTRLTPHPPNFTAAVAACLFAGAHFRQVWLAVTAPLAALFVSDVILNLAVYHRGLFHESSWANYLAYALVILIGVAIRRRRRPHYVICAAAAASVVFFLVSNFGSWAAYSAFYPRSMEGLMACYTAGLPFFRTEMTAMLICSVVLFGGFALAERWWAQLREQPAPAPLPAARR